MCTLKCTAFTDKTTENDSVSTVTSLNCFGSQVVDLLFNKSLKRETHDQASDLLVDKWDIELLKDQMLPSGGDGAHKWMFKGHKHWTKLRQVTRDKRQSKC